MDLQACVSDDFRKILQEYSSLIKWMSHLKIPKETGFLYHHLEQETSFSLSRRFVLQVTNLQLSGNCNSIIFYLKQLAFFPIQISCLIHPTA